MSVGITSAKGPPLPLSCLRLLVPPLHLVSASMWHILLKRDVMRFWEVSEFVSLVKETVPDLLLFKHWTQLKLGLRARLQSEEEDAAGHFLKEMKALLEDDQERREYFQEVFPEEYGPEYDRDLQMLFWEFLSRLDQLLPVPELQQTVSWLNDDGSSIFEDCMQCISEPTHVTDLLQHHNGLGHLNQHVPPSRMGDRVLSSLSAAPQSRQTKQCTAESKLNLFQVPSEEPQPIAFVEDVAMEVITVTEYAEVELGANTDIEEKTPVCTTAADETVVVIPGNEGAAMEEKLPNSLANLAILKAGSQQKTTSRRHSCPECEKKFRFASSLVAHRVIHSGERPHECSECGRCFSFRQSLERHRHKLGRCGTASAEHTRRHTEDGAYGCELCNKKFNLELALAKHMKRHTHDHVHKDTLDIQHKTDRVEAAQTQCTIDPQLMNEVISLVKVRTSGRKRRPTMKVQMIDSRKKMGNKRVKEDEEVKATEMKPEPLNTLEHPYGTSMPSSKEVSVAEDECGPSSSHSSIKPDQGPQTTQEEEGRFSCSGCNKIFQFLSVLISHQRIHTGEQPYLCAQCGQRFSFRQSLDRHKLTHKSGRKYDCSICGELSDSTVTQHEHSRTHMQNGEYICTSCGRAFAWKSALVRHLKTHSSEGAKGGYKCTHCELDFNCASSLRRHLQTHEEERVHECNCGKTFTHKAALTAHRRIHQKDRPHVCSQCGKGFLYKGGLVSHLKIHSQEMPFMCSYCGKSFKRERNMKKHERCHTRENVFQCSKCDKGFVYKATLTRHELTHSGERPYLCSDCGKGFFSHAELIKHQRFHTGHKPFECPHCGKRFTQSCYLTIHLRYHTGARPYPCSECDKSFLSANRLKRHQRTHTGEKPYVCGECGKGFRQSYHLKMHQRTHALKLM